MLFGQIGLYVMEGFQGYASDCVFDMHRLKDQLAWKKQIIISKDEMQNKMSRNENMF